MWFGQGKLLEQKDRSLNANGFSLYKWRTGLLRILVLTRHAKGIPATSESCHFAPKRLTPRMSPLLQRLQYPFGRTDPKTSVLHTITMYVHTYVLKHGSIHIYVLVKEFGAAMNMRAWCSLCVSPLKCALCGDTVLLFVLSVCQCTSKWSTQASFKFIQETVETSVASACVDTSRIALCGCHGMHVKPFLERSWQFQV